MLCICPGGAVVVVFHTVFTSDLYCDLCICTVVCLIIVGMLETRDGWIHSGSLLRNNTHYCHRLWKDGQIFTSSKAEPKHLDCPLVVDSSKIPPHRCLTALIKFSYHLSRIAENNEPRV